MANLEQLINEKTAADSQWRQQRQTERQSITEMQDNEIEHITTDPAAYARYLNMQADNMTYSPGNIALVMAQSPTATVFGTMERWRNMGRNVRNDELGKGIEIFARAESGMGYSITAAYDISQTDGREPRKPLQLTDESKEMEAALKALLNYSTVPVVADTEMEAPAFYDQGNLELAINPAYSDSEVFVAIAAEVAHARFHDRGIIVITSGRTANWTPRACPISCAADSASAGICPTCPGYRISTRAGCPRTDAPSWTASRI